MFGPAMLMPKNNDDVKDTSIRIINDYFPPTDDFLTRLDIKIEDKHFVVGFNSTRNGECDLVIPSKVEMVLGVKTSKAELISSLEELLDHLKNDA